MTRSRLHEEPAMRNPLDVRRAKLSVVSTLYHSSPFLREFIARAGKAAALVTEEYEIILVDDGSPDDSLARAISYASKDCRIRVLELSRNFGHHAAILAGLEAATGDLVFLVDSDLEEPPEYLADFHRMMTEANADVVYGIHDQVVGSRFRRLSSGIFWKLFNFLSDTKSAENICHIRLMKRDYVDALLLLAERNVFLGGLYVWPGYHQVAYRIDRTINRAASTYGVVDRLNLFISSMTAFSIRPLQVIFILGSAIAVISAVVALAFLIERLVLGREMLSGFASLIISIWFLSGLIIMALGVIGLYLGHVYMEAKQRPRALVRRIHKSPTAVLDPHEAAEPCDE